MPLARIDLAQGKSVDYRRTVGQVVYDAMVAALNAPEDDRFQVVTEHPQDDVIADPGYLGIRRSKDCIFIQLTLNEGRTLEQKRAFYKAVATACISVSTCAARTSSSTSSRSRRRTGRSGTARRNMRNDIGSRVIDAAAVQEIGR
jgi:4-oxalocrotonate tautomerase